MATALRTEGVHHYLSVDLPDAVGRGLAGDLDTGSVLLRFPMRGTPGASVEVSTDAPVAGEFDTDEQTSRSARVCVVAALETALAQVKATL